MEVQRRVSRRQAWSALLCVAANEIKTDMPAGSGHGVVGQFGKSRPGNELEEKTGQQVETAYADDACENSGNKAKWRNRVTDGGGCEVKGGRFCHKSGFKDKL